MTGERQDPIKVVRGLELDSRSVSLSYLIRPDSIEILRADEYIGTGHPETMIQPYFNEESGNIHDVLSGPQVLRIYEEWRLCPENQDKITTHIKQGSITMTKQGIV